MRYFKYILVFLLLTSLAFSQEKTVTPDEPFQKAQYNFTGAWLPDLDPAEIGPSNFRTLQNLRYAEKHPEGVMGYTKINTTPLATYTSIRSGIQLKSDRTVASYVLVQSENTGETASQVFQNQAVVPAQGDFTATALHTDATGAGVGRFAIVADGHVAYTNGVETMVWAGEEMRVAGFFTAYDSSQTLPVDYTKEVNNTLDSTGNTVTIGVTQLITNGNMEADANWAAVGGATESQSQTQEYSGSNSWTISSAAADEGIQSATFTTVDSTTNYYRVWVFPVTDVTEVNIRIRNGANDADEIDADHTGLTPDAWNIVTGSYDVAVGDGGAGAFLQVRTTSAMAGTDVYYVDDVSVHAAGRPYQIIFSTRPLQGIKYTIETANTVISKLYAEYWNGTAFTACASPADTTTASFIALKQTGTLSFTSTESTVKPYHLEGLYLYAYRVNLTLGSAEVEYVTLDADFQPMVDVWDGVYRQPIQFQYQDDAEWKNYTLEVNYASSTDNAISADISSMIAADDEIVIGFEERMAGIRLEMLEGAINENASVVTVSYWDGDAWTTVGTSMRDETAGTAAKTMNQTGLISWSADAITDEKQSTKFGYTGYFYRITVGSDIAATTSIDFVTGIPAQNTVRAFSFPSRFKNRTLLAGFKVGKEGNRVDYSVTNAPDVFNGAESSMDGVQSLYFGGSEALTAGTELYNRFGSNVFATWVALKNDSTYLLTGDGPEDFKIFPISYNIGCPAPLTLATAEVGFEMAEGVVRNVAIWLSASGPVIFDGAVLSPINGIDKYFDPAESVAIDTDNISVARGWYDPAYKEYNLLIPSGSGQSTNNVWLVYDIPKKKWFTKDTGTAGFPQTAFRADDQYGKGYVYAGIDTGYMMRLENGNDWDGTDIEQILITGDFWPTGSIWDKTRLRHLKIVAIRLDEEDPLNVDILVDGDSDDGVDFVWQDTDDFQWTDVTSRSSFQWVEFSAPEIQLFLNAGNTRIIRTTTGLNQLGWSYGVKFELTTDDSNKGFQPIGFAIQYQYVRDDL